MNNLNGFTFYRSYYESIAAIKDDEDLTDEQKNKRIAVLSMGILEFVFEGKEPELKGMPLSVFCAIKPNLQTSVKRSDAGQTKSSKNQNDIKTQSKPEQDKGQVQGKDKVQEGENTPPEATPPTLAQIHELCDSDGNPREYGTRYHTYYSRPDIAWRSRNGSCIIQIWQTRLRDWCEEEAKKQARAGPAKKPTTMSEDEYYKQFGGNSL